MLNFSKFHGCGNDMVMINNLDGGIELNEEKVRELCDRHFGVGSDGLILVERREGSDCFMNYYNNDGTAVEMCGNGVRCTADFFVRETGWEGDVLKVGTRGGVKDVVVREEGIYEVNMGKPVFEGEVEVREMGLDRVSMGNPHAILFVDDVDGFDLEGIGPGVECADCFPNKTNFEIVEVVDAGLKMRVWERGCGVTLACGTGACAVYASAKRAGMVEGRVRVMLPGGDLWIEENEDGELLMAGAVSKVFDGVIVVEA